MNKIEGGIVKERQIAAIMKLSPENFLLKVSSMPEMDKERIYRHIHNQIFNHKLKMF